MGKAVTEINKGDKNKGLQSQTNGAATYATVAARGPILAGAHNTQSLNLRAHVERAIAQCGNENIANIKIASSNQLKSGDQSIKTASSNEVEALKQFGDDWTPLIGNGATARIPTYGILAHGIRTSTVDMDKFEENRSQILQEKQTIHPAGRNQIYRIANEKRDHQIRLDHH